MPRKSSENADKREFSIDDRIDISTHESILTVYGDLLLEARAGGVDDKSFEQSMRVLKSARETISEQKATGGVAGGAAPLRVVGGKTSTPF